MARCRCIPQYDDVTDGRHQGGHDMVDFGKLTDKAKDLAGANPDKIDDVVEKIGDVVDDKTGGTHTDKIDAAEDKVKDALKGK
jgi:hypothetical protein